MKVVIKVSFMLYLLFGMVNPVLASSTVTPSPTPNVCPGTAVPWTKKGLTTLTPDQLIDPGYSAGCAQCMSSGYSTGTPEPSMGLTWGPLGSLPGELVAILAAGPAPVHYSLNGSATWLVAPLVNGVAVIALRILPYGVVISDPYPFVTVDNFTGVGFQAGDGITIEGGYYGVVTVTPGLTVTPTVNTTPTVTGTVTATPGNSFYLINEGSLVGHRFQNYGPWMTVTTNTCASGDHWVGVQVFGNTVGSNDMVLYSGSFSLRVNTWGLGGVFLGQDYYSQFNLSSWFLPQGHEVDNSQVWMTSWVAYDADCNNCGSSYTDITNVMDLCYGSHGPQPTSTSTLTPTITPTGTSYPLGDCHVPTYIVPTPAVEWGGIGIGEDLPCLIIIPDYSITIGDVTLALPSLGVCITTYSIDPITILGFSIPLTIIAIVPGMWLVVRILQL